MKYINDSLAEAYNKWLRSPDNKNNDGDKKYEQYAYCLNRLIDEARKSGLVKESEIKITDIDWLEKFYMIYNSNESLQVIDRIGIFSLKRFMEFIKFDKYLRFKALLKWFVRRIKINNGILPEPKTDEAKSGVGYNGDRIRKSYQNWREYAGFTIDCTIQCGHAKNKPNSNYIHWTGTEIDIQPVFVKVGDKSDVQGLITVNKDKNENINNGVTIKNLGLLDENYPNDTLKEFFDQYLAAVQNAEIIKQEVTENKMEEANRVVRHELNLILYGPPGTGKTYNTVNYAVAICENKSYEDVAKESYDAVFKRYKALLADGRIAFTTFHQSYGYEEFIEGIKPDFAAEEIKYQRADGVFKKFCDKAARFKFLFNLNSVFNSHATVWKVSLGGAGKNDIREDCMKNNHIRIGWDDYGAEISDETNFNDGGSRVLNAFINNMSIGDVVLSCYSATEIDAIGIVEGDYEWHGDYKNYKRVRKVKWLIQGIRKDITDINNGKRMSQQAVYCLDISTNEIAKLINNQEDPDVKVERDYSEPYVFIIDEINRGNVSKIFGELITLIEPTKRLGAQEEMTCTLPYSGAEFGVPKNVYLLGTMNTADRSLVQLDAALRRRFAFKEMMPDYGVIKKVGTVDGIDVAELLKTINDRITCLLDREHQIGHSYFMKLAENGSVAKLAEIFRENIIPLLQEYFFDDYESIKKVLNGVFVETEPNPFNYSRQIFSIAVTEEPNDYRKIYHSGADDSTDNG